MKTGDLSTGAARLKEAADTLKLQWHNASDHWDDTAAAQFHRQYLAPLEPRLERALEAVHRLTHVLGKAQRECDDE